MSTLDEMGEGVMMNSREVRGAAALLQMLECIGNTDVYADQRIAQILVDNEQYLRALLRCCLMWRVT